MIDARDDAALRELYQFCEDRDYGQYKPFFVIVGYTHDEVYTVQIQDRKGGRPTATAHVTGTLAEAIFEALNVARENFPKQKDEMVQSCPACGRCDS